jgi:hypothetical protein
MYTPIMEMVQFRHSYYPEICYYYNQFTGLNNHILKKDEQLENEKKIKARHSYQVIK